MDQISPLLFLLVIEVFMRMLCSATAAGLLSRFSVSRMNLATIKVSHLFSANDTIIFCDNDCEQMVNIRYILVWFEAVSSLRVNLDKSSSTSVGYWVRLIIANFLQVFLVAKLTT